MTGPEAGGWELCREEGSHPHLWWDPRDRGTGWAPCQLGRGCRQRSEPCSVLGQRTPAGGKGPCSGWFMHQLECAFGFDLSVPQKEADAMPSALSTSAGCALLFAAWVGSRPVGLEGSLNGRLQRLGISRVLVTGGPHPVSSLAPLARRSCSVVPVLSRSWSDQPGILWPSLGTKALGLDGATLPCRTCVGPEHQLLPGRVWGAVTAAAVHTCWRVHDSVNPVDSSTALPGVALLTPRYRWDTESMAKVTKLAGRG